MKIISTFFVFQKNGNDHLIQGTLKEETFAGRNFRGFAVFSQIRESLFQRNVSKYVIRKSFFLRNFAKVVIRERLFPRNFLKKSSSANILIKIHFCSYSLQNCYSREKMDVWSTSFTLYFVEFSFLLYTDY